MKEYPSTEYMKTLCGELKKYMPAMVSAEIKPKRELQVKEAYGKIYEAQLLAISVVRDIEVSHLLGMNDVVMPHIVKEYAMLAFALKTITNRLKVMKQFEGDLNGTVSVMVQSFNIKEINSRLYSDLKCLADCYNLDLDLKYWMQEYKQSQMSEDFVKRITGENI